MDHYIRISKLPIKIQYYSVSIVGNWSVSLHKTSSKPVIVLLTTYWPLVGYKGIWDLAPVSNFIIEANLKFSNFLRRSAR